MPQPPAPWDVVLGSTPGGDTVILPGPQGPQGLPGINGANGAQGPVGPVAAPLAKYILDTADAGLVNGVVVHRALGPDRVPSVSSALNDEMITEGTGYDASKWSLHNNGTGTIHSDPVGGVCFDLKDNSKWVWLEQLFSAGANYDFVTKIAIGIAQADTAVYAGLALVVPGDISLGNTYWQTLVMGWNGGANFFFRDEGFADTDRTNLLFTQIGLPQYRAQGWWYLRVRNVGTNHEFLVSENGLTWQSLGVRTLPGPVGGIRLQSYFHGTSNPAPVYYQFFRSLI